MIKDKEFIDLCMNMVVKYYNNYVHMIDYPTINLDNVHVVDFKDYDDNDDNIILEAKLKVDIDPWLQYNVTYKKLNDRYIILSSTECV